LVNYFFLREEKRRRKRTFRPGELFHFQIKPDRPIENDPDFVDSDTIELFKPIE